MNKKLLIGAVAGGTAAAGIAATKKTPVPSKNMPRSPKCLIT